MNVPLTSLNFSTPNNAAISLRVLSEMVRAGDVVCLKDNTATLTLTFVSKAPVNKTRE